MKNQKLEEFYNKYLRNSMAVCFLVAILLNLFMETLARQSTPVIGGLLYLIQNPLVFLANTLIIMASLWLPSLPCRRWSRRKRPAWSSSSGWDAKTWMKCGRSPGKSF